MAKTKPTTLDQAFLDVTEELFETFLKKHRDYGKGNILAIEELGIALREAEKVERLKHLLKTNSDPQNESIEDNWIDVGVYAVIALLYRRGHFQKLEVDAKVAEKLLIK